MQIPSKTSRLPSPQLGSATARTRTTSSRIQFSRLHRLLPVSCYARVTRLDATDEIEEVAKFKEASKRGNLVPLQRTMFSDHLTPVLAYRCLVKEDDREAPSFLFESVEQGSTGTSMGRYSVVGAQPAMEIVAKENAVSIMDHDEGRLTEELR